MFGSQSTSLPAALAVFLLSSAIWAEPSPGTQLAEGPPAVPRPPAARPRLPLTSRLAQSTVRAALRAAGHPRRQLELESLASRARAAALLPSLSFRAMRSTDQTLRLTPTLDDPAHYSESGGAGLWLEGRLSWELDRLLYDRDELAVVRLQGERASVAGKLASRVLETLFAWQRARLRERDPGLGPEGSEEARLAVAEAEVTLDLLTDGWFTSEGLRIAQPKGR